MVPLPPRAYVFISLNLVRFLSLIGLLLVFASSILVMVNDIKAVNNFMHASSTNSTEAEDMLDCDYIEDSTVPNQPAGVFWAVTNRLLIIAQVVVLILSEVGWPMSFFQRFFPVLGQDFGLGALGIFQGLIGAAVLSHHVDDFSLVSAFFLFAIACVNMLLGLIFREKAKAKRSITTWREEKKNLLPKVHDTGSSRPTFGSAPPSFVSWNAKARDNSSSPYPDEKAGYGFGRQGERKAALKGFLINRPVESLPQYLPTTNAPRAPSEHGSEHASEHGSEHASGSRSPSPAPRAQTPTFHSSPEAI